VENTYRNCVTAIGKEQWTFGIYIKMYFNQKGRCLICNKKVSPLAWSGLHQKRTATIDHNHGNNEVRALLCYRCNLCLGACRESSGILAKMIWYLDEYGNFGEEDSSSMDSDVDVVYV